VIQDKFTEAVDAVLEVSQDPSKGLTDEVLETQKANYEDNYWEAKLGGKNLLLFGAGLAISVAGYMKFMSKK